MSDVKDLKQRFLKVYSSLPIGTRKEIILVLKEHGPVTWQSAYIEVDNDTKLGAEILKKLGELKII